MNFSWSLLSFYSEHAPRLYSVNEFFDIVCSQGSNNHLFSVYLTLLRSCSDRKAVLPKSTCTLHRYPCCVRILIMSALSLCHNLDRLVLIIFSVVRTFPKFVLLNLFAHCRNNEIFRRNLFFSLVYFENHSRVIKWFMFNHHHHIPAIIKVNYLLLHVNHKQFSCNKYRHVVHRKPSKQLVQLAFADMEGFNFSHLFRLQYCQVPTTPGQISRSARAHEPVQ